MRVYRRVDAGVEVEGYFLEEANATDRGNGDTEWHSVDFGSGSQAAAEGLGGGEGGGEKSEEEGERLGCRV